MRSSSILIPLLLVPLIHTPAHATALIDVGDAKLLPDSSGTLDVYISSDVVPGGELLNVANFELRITPAAGTSSTLEFVSPQANAYPLDPVYVFFANSAGPIRSVSSVSQPRDTLIVGDSTSNFEDVTVMSGRLLARLEFDHEFPAGVDRDSTLGHNFAIDVVPSANTFFWDQNLNPLSYSGHGGTVFIVPEPSRGLILIEVCLGWALIWRRR